ncbi:Probable LRR receptor-like serine/threonine-protein kinase At2g16250 [Linum perenne]
MEEFQSWGFLRLVLLIWVLVHRAAGQQSTVSLSDRVEWTALIDLRASLGIRSADWPIKADPCTKWKGVHCSGNGRVTGINISGFKRTRIGRLNPGFNIDSIANFSFLEVFNASGFSLPGSIPGSLFKSSLRVLDLRSTSVSGRIPASIGELNQLNELYLSGNQLAGSVPTELGELGRISAVDLSRNLLTGSIPSGFGSRSNLSRLDLSSNYLSGSIPPGLFGNVSRLQFLDLSDNSFSGSIPEELGSLSKLVYLNISQNLLSGSLPSSWLALPSLQTVDVSANNFTGDVQKLSFNGTASSAALLNLSNNMLYGTLAAAASPFGNFSSVDISGNYIQGKVFVNTPRKVMILDSNCLQVVSNQRSLENCRSFYDQRELAFDEFGAPLPSPPSESDQKKSKTWIYILVGVLGGIIFIVGLALVLVLLLRKFDRNSSSPRGSPNVRPVPEGDGNTSATSKDQTNISGLGKSFTYEHLQSFISEKNLIKHGHSGDLFKGFLEREGGDGVPVVVKRVDLGSTRKDPYMVELEFFSKYSHTRLLPLLGHCLENEKEKFLVYKYMPNGDLATSLHKVVSNVEGDGLQSLDWITRLKIAIGAAEGLCYLHHDCSPPIVHRDIQASSILLDDKFEVRLGSLSEIHVQEGDSHHNKIITRFLRKQLSSESSSSGSLMAATCSYDVYCFGKVLLELITGKIGVSKLDDATTRDWLDHTLGCISIYDKELVTKIVDSSMMVDEDLLEEVWAVAIVARSCLNPKASKRPPMKYILRALENPFKVVRNESYNSSGRLQTTSSQRSWSTSFFGSWRHSSSENTMGLNHGNRDGISSSKQPARVGSYSSGGIEFPSSRKRLSKEIFPEPLDIQDIERQDPDYH